MRVGFGSLAVALLIAGCSKSEPAPDEIRAFDVQEDRTVFGSMQAEKQDIPPGSPRLMPNASQNVPATSKVTEPRIAYKYRHGYRLNAGDVGRVQQTHLAMCDKLGTAHCRVVSLERAYSDGEFVQASLNLQVDASKARSFGSELDKAVGDAGGEVSDQGIEAEDLSKQMVDTQARITAKQALADRLLLLLKNRTGKVGELVEAERAYSQAQEELDAARSWMAEMQQRVSSSRIDISYNSSAPSSNGLWRPVRESLSSAGQTIGNSIGSLISFLAVILPWLFSFIGAVWVVRRLGWAKRLKLPWPKRRRKNDVDD